MTTKEKLELVDGFDRAYDGIGLLVATLPDEAISYTPPIPDAWSINSHLVHLLDADTAICFRLRVAVAQPGFLIPVWDEEAWYARLEYASISGRVAFGQAIGMRRLYSTWLRSLAGKDWNEFHVQHPIRGRMGLVDLLAAYRDHGRTHEGFIKRNKESWESSRGAG